MCVHARHVCVFVCACQACVYVCVCGGGIRSWQQFEMVIVTNLMLGIDVSEVQFFVED